MTAPGAAVPALELFVDDYVLRLDGNVLEVLHRHAAFRWHVAHVAIDAKERDGQLRLRIGIREHEMVVDGARITVPAGQREAVLGLLAEARRRREALPPAAVPG